MNRYLAQIEEAVRATTIHPPETFSWFKERSQPLAPQVKRALGPQILRNHLLTTLQNHLYFHFYCQGQASPFHKNKSQGHNPVVSIPFVERLSQANAGRGYWQKDWMINRLQNDSLIVRRAGIELQVVRGDIRTPPDMDITPGLKVHLHLPKEFLGMSPEFYMALGDESLTPDDWQRRIVRFYWHLSAEGAIHFMGSATSRLNRAGVPFSLKVLKSLSNSTRCDAVVLYLKTGDYDRIYEILKEIYADVKVYMRQGIPTLTKFLAPGLALAEDPGLGASFGLQRCGLLAEGIIAAQEQGVKTLPERVQMVTARLSEANIDLARPYLNPGSEDKYHFSISCSRPAPCAASRGETELLPADPQICLRTARDIGQSLCREAFWYRNRCNWMGTMPSGQDVTSFSALGPELYAGTSGVGLFLAELFAATGDPVLERTALGAIQQTLSRIEAISADKILGLHTGWLGIAWATARVGEILQKQELLERARRLIHRTAGRYQPNAEFDVVSGNAGAIPILVALGQEWQDAELLDFALRLGEEFLAAASTWNEIYAWRTINSANEQPLTGFSHGMAGIGYALLELFAVTGDPRHRQAAIGAFNYEGQWFDAARGNWKDLRGEPARRKRLSHPSSFATTWCHGAPGIALSRVRAYHLLQNKDYKSQAITGLQTTSNMLEKELLRRTFNFSLCHGFAGNAEVLLIGEQVLGRENFSAETARKTAQAGIKWYGEPGQQWPCGAGGGTTPGLMLGLAGIGYFYLRLYAPEIPSVLLVYGRSSSSSNLETLLPGEKRIKEENNARHSHAV